MFGDYDFSGPENMRVLLLLAKASPKIGFCTACGKANHKCMPLTRANVCECMKPSIYSVPKIIRHVVKQVSSFQDALDLFDVVSIDIEAMHLDEKDHANRLDALLPDPTQQ